MKPAIIKVRVISGTEYGKTGTIKNCIEENGEHYYYIRVKGQKGLTLYHATQIEIK